MLIREEEGKLQAGGDNKQVLEGLRSVKANYIEQKKVFTDTLKNVKDEDIFGKDESSEDIDKLISNLYALPLNGPTIKKVVETMRSSNQHVQITKNLLGKK